MFQIRNTVKIGDRRLGRADRTCKQDRWYFVFQDHLQAFTKLFDVEDEIVVKKVIRWKTLAAE